MSRGVADSSALFEGLSAPLFRYRAIPSRFVKAEHASNGEHMEMTAEDPTATDTCSYVRSDGSRCPAAVEDRERDLCFWHDVEISKEGPDVRERLEAWAESGQSMEGFLLRYAALEGLKLSTKRSRDLRRANLFRANLQGASLFNVDLRGAVLLKANLAGANLNEALLQDAELLGINLDGTRLESVEWGELCLNEQQAIQAEREGNRDESQARYKEAEQVYRSLRRAYAAIAETRQAGLFFRREMTILRRLMPLWSASRAWSKLVDLTCAYGESPPRVIISALILNLTCAVGYYFAGIMSPAGWVKFDPSAGLETNLVQFFECVYYSIVTFTTLGYSDEARQIWLVRPLAAAQAFVGAFMMALFVVVFGKKMTRS